jgi:hypothetical protein
LIPRVQEYHFKIQYDRFSAELAVDGNCSLYDLAKLINQAVGFAFDHAFEFCDNLKNPHRSKERYTLFADMGEDTDNSGVKKTPLSAVFRPRRKMIFHFDYGDDWFFLVTCTAAKESSAKRPFKKVVSTHGTPPEQYPDFKE